MGQQSAEIQALHRSQQYEKVVDLWIKKYQKQPRINFRIALTTLQCYRELRRYDDAFNLGLRLTQLLLDPALNVKPELILSLLPTVSISISRVQNGVHLREFIERLHASKIPVVIPAYIHITCQFHETQSSEQTVLLLRKLAQEYPEILQAPNQMSDLLAVFIKNHAMEGVPLLFEFMQEQQIEFSPASFRPLLDAALSRMIPPEQLEPYLAAVETLEPEKFDLDLLISYARVIFKLRMGTPEHPIEVWHASKERLMSNRSSYKIYRMLHHLIELCCVVGSLDAAIQFYIETFEHKIRNVSKDISPFRALFTFQHPKLIAFAARNLVEDFEYTDGYGDIHHVPQAKVESLRQGRALSSCFRAFIEHEYYKAALVLTPYLVNDSSQDPLSCKLALKMIERLRQHITPLDSEAFGKTELKWVIGEMERINFEDSLPEPLFKAFTEGLTSLLSRLDEVSHKSM